MGGLAPVITMDGRTIGDGAPGPVTGRLTELFADLTARTGTLLSWCDGSTAAGADWAHDRGGGSPGNARCPAASRCR